MAFGTLVTLDTLAASQQTIAEIGEDRVFNALKASLDAHNQLTNEQMSALVERTTDRQRRYGGDDNVTFEEVDEFGRADAQKVSAGITVGFPLRATSVSVQWTRLFFLNATGAELAAQFTAVQKGHRRRIQRELKRVLFNPTNTNNWVDRRIDSVQLNLKALVNADGAPIPSGPNGETFDGSTHTHYLARAGGSLAASDVTGLLYTSREHYNSGQQMLYINMAQEAAIRTMTANFTPYVDARIVQAQNANGTNISLQPFNPNNRAIGVFDGAEVWIKPWVPAGYMLTWIMGVNKPLVMRERRPGSGNLEMLAEDESYPLRARTIGAEFGFGVWNRTAAAVLYTGGTTYTAPTIND